VFPIAWLFPRWLGLGTGWRAAGLHQGDYLLLPEIAIYIQLQFTISSFLPWRLLSGDTAVHRA
jgi:hypothetical protein